jgi:membrane-bound serine protease (ClpP class)
MAPSTNIGAAHPVQMGREEQKRTIWDTLRDAIDDYRKQKEETKTIEKDKKEEKREKKDIVDHREDGDKKEVYKADEDPMSDKILQDTVAFIKAIAKERSRNEEWAIQSVTESSSITEQEALEKGVVEIIARDEQDLLGQLDGRVVKIADQEITLQTKNALLSHIEMDYRQRFLNVLANPNIAYIFLILGFYGLLYEVTHPGFGAPGILGAIFLILAFFSLQTLPTPCAGLRSVDINRCDLYALGFNHPFRSNDSYDACFLRFSPSDDTDHSRLNSIFSSFDC